MKGFLQCNICPWQYFWNGLGFFFFFGNVYWLISFQFLWCSTILNSICPGLCQSLQKCQTECKMKCWQWLHSDNLSLIQTTKEHLLFIYASISIHLLSEIFKHTTRPPPSPALSSLCCLLLTWIWGVDRMRCSQNRCSPGHELGGACWMAAQSGGERSWSWRECHLSSMDPCIAALPRILWGPQIRTLASSSLVCILGSTGAHEYEVFCGGGRFKLFHNILTELYSIFYFTVN